MNVEYRAFHEVCYHFINRAECRELSVLRRGPKTACGMNKMNSLIRFCFYAVIGYGLLVLIVFLLQRRLIYAPENFRPSVDALQTMGLSFWPEAIGDFRGFISVDPSGDFQGTVVVFHGNAGSAWQRDYFIRALQPLGYRVILAEYPGYGGRSGKTNEVALVQDAITTIKDVRSVFGAPIYLLGESMGCGVVAAAAACPAINASGLILITPWDSLPDLAQTLYWYLPARMLTIDRFDSVHNLQSFDRPVAMVIAKNDSVVPNKHSLRLFHSLTAPKRLWEFQGAGHNSWPTEADAPWWREAMAFVTATVHSQIDVASYLHVGSC
jgi:alpha-beta hydrolase superfamily lysophospholipase